jgi:hypothetical protein
MKLLDGIARRDKSNSRLDVFNLKLRIDPSSSHLFSPDHGTPSPDHGTTVVWTSP